MLLPSRALISGREIALEALNLPSMVLSAARRQGTATAAVDGDASISYAALLRAADQVASHLIGQHRIAKGDVVAVSMERSISLICVVLGIQRAGAVYLPVVANSPAARMKFILCDAKAELLV
ncbi:MAG: AMP-binding protein, partial [Algiphilus sp.]